MFNSDANLMTISEVQELNSECAFCGLLKFTTQSVKVIGGVPYFEMVRCDDSHCEIHCHWKHDSKFELTNPSDDNWEIAAGWGTH